MKQEPLKIAFLAWNVTCTAETLHTLAVVNAEQVHRYERNMGRVILKDGTIVQGVYPGKCLEGMRFDQVIVADDRRLRLLHFRGAVLNELDMRCQGSTVPEDYRFQFYDLDEEAPTNGI